MVVCGIGGAEDGVVKDRSTVPCHYQTHIYEGYV